MSKTCRLWDVDQAWLLPASVHDLVPADHPAHFVREIVRQSLDLSAILASYEGEERGQPPYHPAMMTALLLYTYSRGLYSSRAIARTCAERLDMMAVTGMQTPDVRTISEFRRRHLEALAGLFAQVLALCHKAGLVQLGHVALEPALGPAQPDPWGTKLKPNASKHKAMSYGRMGQREQQLRAEVERWFAQAARADAAEDGAHGPERRRELVLGPAQPDPWELPAWVADQQVRLEKIRQAKAALEAEAATLMPLPLGPAPTSPSPADPFRRQAPRCPARAYRRTQHPLRPNSLVGAC